MSQPIYLPPAPAYLPVTNPVPMQIPPATWPASARAVPAPASANGARPGSLASLSGGLAQQPPKAGTMNAPRPIFRAKGPDEPASPLAMSSQATPMRLSIPTPEQLGVGQSPFQDGTRSDGTGLDWTAAHRRLERLGAVCFHMDKLESGACRFTCILPTRQPGITHRVEAEAATAPNAVASGLSQAEQWAGSANGASK